MKETKYLMNHKVVNRVDKMSQRRNKRVLNKSTLANQIILQLQRNRFDHVKHLISPSKNFDFISF